MKYIKNILVALTIGIILTPLVPAKAEDPSVLCMAKVIYHEARGESLAGKLAVAKVTLNRMQSNRFPTTACGVVYQKGQYSWTIKEPKVKDKKAWQDAVNIAKNAIETGLTELDGFRAMYFRAKYVHPTWKNHKIVAIIGNHVFYS